MLIMVKVNQCIYMFYKIILLLNTVAYSYKVPLTVAFIICTLTLLSPLSSSQVYAASPYDSGYDHGCSDAGISDPSSQYINEPGKGPSYHTSEFMDGYYAGVDTCSGTNDETYQSETQEPVQTQQPIQNDRGVKITEMCTAFTNGDYVLAEGIAT